MNVTNGEGDGIAVRYETLAIPDVGFKLFIVYLLRTRFVGITT